MNQTTEGERQSYSFRLARTLVSWRLVLLCLAALLAIVCWLPASDLQFDQRIENMFAAEDPILVPYEKLKRTFGGNELVLAVYEDDELFTPSGMKRLNSLSSRLAKVEGVSSVLSFDQLLLGEDFNKSTAMVNRYLGLFEGYTHGADRKTAVVTCMLKPKREASRGGSRSNEPAKVAVPKDADATEGENTRTAVPHRIATTDAARSRTIGEIREIVEEEVGTRGGLIAGEPVMVVDGFRYIEEDGERLGIVSSGLLMLTIILCFRSVRWVLIPLVVVQLSLLLTRASLVLSGFKLSMVSTMLTAIVTVVGVATVIHIIVQFREARTFDLTPREALIRALGVLLVPIFWACSTDAVGFSSLLKARVGPVQDFGIMMATGSMFVIVSVVLLVPGLALLWGKIDPDPQRVWGETSLENTLSSLLRLVSRKPKTICLVTLVVAVVVSLGSTRLEVETDFTKNFRSTSPIVKSYAFVEQRLGGAGAWDLFVPAPSPQQLQWADLKKVLILEDRIEKEVPGVTNILSLARAVNQSSPVDIDSKGRLMQRVMTNTAIGGMRSMLPDFVSALHNADPQQEDQYYFRIMLRSKERLPAEQKQQQIQAVTRISRELYPDAQVTGFFVLLTNLIESMIRDQWITFGIAMLGIGLMMLVAFWDIRLAVVALVPNALPILMVTGLMGWLGLKINMGAAMIAAVSLGLSIDSSIHYIRSFLRGRRQGLHVAAALEYAQTSVGRALVFSTLALIVGFLAMCQSEFVPTVYFGALVSLSMLGGLLGNLIVLPLLIRAVMRDNPNSQ